LSGAYASGLMNIKWQFKKFLNIDSSKLFLKVNILIQCLKPIKAVEAENQQVLALSQATSTANGYPETSARET
jgi:hypothetical protein